MLAASSLLQSSSTHNPGNFTGPKAGSTLALRYIGFRARCQPAILKHLLEPRLVCFAWPLEALPWQEASNRCMLHWNETEAGHLQGFVLYMLTRRLLEPIICTRLSRNTEQKRARAQQDEDRKLNKTAGGGRGVHLPEGIPARQSWWRTPPSQR